MAHVDGSQLMASAQNDRVTGWTREMPGRRRVLAQLALVVGVLLVGTSASVAASPSGGNPVVGHPAPVLFTTSAVSPLARDLARVRVRADAAFAGWATTHPRPDDAAFTAFAMAQLPPPPAGAVQAQELTELRQLAARRTRAGIKAANWLEVYGKADVWKVYLRDAVEFGDATSAKVATAMLKADTRLAGRLAKQAEAHFHRPSPSAVEPTLRKHARPQKLSYPSTHAVYVHSELVVLSALDPHRAAEFQQMTGQVDYSRLYAAGHYRSDLVAGTFLGDLIGDYEVRNATTAAARGRPPAARPVP